MNPTSDQVRQVWERIAPWWDREIGEGNDFQKSLIMPATDRLLEPVAGQTILDIACGNGNYARRLGALGANIVACDYCQEFLECAKKKTESQHGNIQYRHPDATNLHQLLELGEGRFDSAVCSMGLMDIPSIEPLLGALGRLLRPDGRFVFSLPHPCFNSNRSIMTAQLINEASEVRQVFGVAIEKYLESDTDLSSGILNQPEPHYFFHRSLSAIFAKCFAAGFVIDGFEEPAFGPGVKGGANAFSWAKRPQIPPAIVVRVRPMGR